MKKLVRLKERRSTRPVRLAVSAVALAVAVAGAAGIVAGQGNAAPAHKAGLLTAALRMPARGPTA
jgi:hypothetical protein